MQKKITAFTSPKATVKDDEENVPEEVDAPPEKRQTRKKAESKSVDNTTTDHQKKEPKKTKKDEESSSDNEEPPAKKTKTQPKAAKGEPKPINQTASDYKKMNLKCTKKSPDGRDWNFKISSWNVVSLNALAKKNGLEFVWRESPDVMCFQETKCNEKNLPDDAKIDGYHRYFVSGE